MTPEPTQEVTPEPTAEVTPEPTAEPEPDPVDDPVDPDVDPDDSNVVYGGDYGDGFGAEFMLEPVNKVDVIATTYYGVYCQSVSDPRVGFFYVYDGDEMSMESMYEFSAAFLDLGIEEDQAQLCFSEEGMNEDVTWTMEEDEFGPYIVLNDSYTGEAYKGRFYWDNDNNRLFVCVRIGDYDVWMTGDTRVIPIGMSEDLAIQAVESYISVTNESLSEMLNTGDYGVAIGSDSVDRENIRVWVRSYTGAYIFFYIDPLSGETHMTEYAPMGDDAVETPLDESFNAWDYMDY